MPVGIEVTTVVSDADFADFAQLVREYVAGLPFALDFQDLDGELADLPAAYGPPAGRALLARDAAGALGCVAVRRLDGDVAELKRMYVRPAGRGRGLGRRLAAAALEAAGELGYRAIRLDTSADMTSAIAIYEALGFAPIAPYRRNPLERARYFEAQLSHAPATAVEQDAP